METPGDERDTQLGASLARNECMFRVWAPHASHVKLQLMNAQGERVLEMERRHGDHFELQTFARAGDRYSYLVDDHKPVPDPLSRLLPEGVHRPTEIVDPKNFAWSDSNWRGLPLKDYIFYELHVGTFTPQGTFDAVIGKLPYLKDLGVTVIELMPVAAFPGGRNWGYDGVSPYAVQAGYGGPEGLKRLVDAAHAAGLAVVLDVVYNHLGNEGNYLPLFGPYFTTRHRTPWGEAINYDQAGSEGVRHYIAGNARYWIKEYHLDGLRLDAVQTIYDESPVHILAEIKDSVTALAGELGREICVIAETDENDEKIVRNRKLGGYGLDALWSDDFHHAVHAFLTGERRGYYQDFGHPEQIARALNEGFVFQGEPFRFWKGRPRGTSPRNMPNPAHVICTQNHDQAGNRAQGERLTALVPGDARRVAAALLLLAPQTPLLFMGQEYDETNPFLFFTDYGDPALQKAVSEGRRKEFRDFGFEDIPDPQSMETFERSKLNWNLAEGESAARDWYKALIALRKQYIRDSDRTCKAEIRNGILVMQTPAAQPRLKLYCRLDGDAQLPQPGAEWKKALSCGAVGIYVVQ
ncbi:MAG TPA: malto-oligosyltrehalose trehalohydrolase [Candidatus Angelobacter sp.]|jgi:maltooligosyltrehalose trehalohydrolase|nr:malto-oligosyltrehalose trehalohydrolase [Candidatus Angelobacter sp.]